MPASAWTPTGITSTIFPGKPANTTSSSATNSAAPPSPRFSIANSAAELDFDNLQEFISWHSNPSDFGSQRSRQYQSQHLREFPRRLRAGQFPLEEKRHHQSGLALRLFRHRAGEARELYQHRPHHWLWFRCRPEPLVSARLQQLGTARQRRLGRYRQRQNSCARRLRHFLRRLSLRTCLWATCRKTPALIPARPTQGSALIHLFCSVNSGNRLIPTRSGFSGSRTRSSMRLALINTCAPRTCRISI